MRADEILQALEQRLHGARPGLSAQLRLAPDPRPGTTIYTEVPGGCQNAGVLVLLYAKGDGDRLHVLLTRRTDRVLHHRDQISFPGGRQEPGEDLSQTALREAQEEVGVPPDFLRVLGPLTPLFIPPSNYCIFPTVASAPGSFDFRPSDHEVAEVLEVPVDHLLDPKNLKRERWRLRDSDVSVPFYQFQQDKIWGATAMVLSELLEIIKPSPTGLLGRRS
jgi:8-oxo-dGTP pyrophosphatase MutT (NUDIX family)